MRVKVTASPLDAAGTSGWIHRPLTGWASGTTSEDAELFPAGRAEMRLGGQNFAKHVDVDVATPCEQVEHRSPADFLLLPLAGTRFGHRDRGGDGHVQ